jgi:hypothetical protein
VISVITLLCSACSTTSTPLQGSILNPAQSSPENIDVRGLRVNVLQGKNANVYGLDVGLVNEVEESVSGVQLAGFVNFAGELTGVQLAGLLNRSKSVVGVQISSLVNDTEKLVGLQIGLLNFNSSGPLRFFPFFNFGFADESEEAEGSKANKD